MKKEALLYQKLDQDKVHCFLCAHHCKIASGQFGICAVRKNENGKLYSLVYGELIASHVDPIEKKPLYHFYPGSYSYSIATVGCNFRCGFCQNWQISQLSKKDEQSYGEIKAEPKNIVDEAIAQNCKSISYTYTEPTIFFEYAYDIAKLSKKQGLANIFVTNGFMTRKALDLIRPFLDAANVDLKSFSEEYYKKTCKASLSPVLDTIKNMKELGVWVEVTTLIIPGENDSDEEMDNIAKFIAGVDKNIPWHISRFHASYKYEGYNATPIETLRMARDIGRKNGLNYIYMGNVAADANTYCPNCKRLLVNRDFFMSDSSAIKDNKCSFCRSEIKGFWS